MHLNLHEQVEKDFARVRRKASLRCMGALLRRDASSNRLLSFEEVSSGLGTVGQVDLGVKAVPISKIVGSVGRHGDFDRAFLPAKGHLDERWKRIDRMMHRAGELPPVSLYKSGESYFALDGNHRVSVARYHGAQWIDARVIEVHSRVSEKNRPRPKSREHRIARQDGSRSKASTERTQNARPAAPPEGPSAGPPEPPGRVPGVTRRRRRSRPKNPKALRNDPQRMMAGARIRRDVRRRVEQALADPVVVGDDGTNYSLLVESLLVRWLEEVGYPLEER